MLLKAYSADGQYLQLPVALMMMMMATHLFGSS